MSNFVTIVGWPDPTKPIQLIADVRIHHIPCWKRTPSFIHFNIFFELREAPSICILYSKQGIFWNAGGCAIETEDDRGAINEFSDIFSVISLQIPAKTMTEIK